jgi:hypothetical protein
MRPATLTVEDEAARDGHRRHCAGVVLVAADVPAALPSLLGVVVRPPVAGAAQVERVARAPLVLVADGDGAAVGVVGG